MVAAESASARMMTRPYRSLKSRSLADAAAERGNQIREPVQHLEIDAIRRYTLLRRAESPDARDRVPASPSRPPNRLDDEDPARRGRATVAELAEVSGETTSRSARDLRLRRAARFPTRAARMMRATIARALV